MELLLKREQVMRGVETAKAFAGTASDPKVLQHAMVSGGFGKVRLTTTDLDVWCQVELTDEIIRPGKALVPAKASREGVEEPAGARLLDAPGSR